MDPLPDFDPAPDDPEIAALLTFIPVVRKNKRHDGWSLSHQRGFIAWLALTGNVDKAAQALGRTQSGAWGVRNAAGGGGFAAAWEAALALFHARRRAGKREALGEAPSGPRHTPRHAREAREAQMFGQREPFRGGTRFRGAGSRTPAGEPDLEEAEVEAFLDELLGRYLVKLRAERAARLDGRIVEADFCVRQLTCIELILDIGGRTQAVLELFHGQGLDPLRIAATPGSVLLEKARRAFWLEKGEADRPPPAPLGRHNAHYATGRDDYDPERDGDRKDWERRQKEKQRLAAEAQAEWEQRARAEAPGEPSRPLSGPANDGPEDTSGPLAARGESGPPRTGPANDDDPPR